MILGPVFRRLSCLTFLCGCRFFRTVVLNTHTVIMRTHIYTYRITRAYCKLQKLLPLAKLISKYTSWHLMPSVTEVRAKDPAGGLKFTYFDDASSIRKKKTCNSSSIKICWLFYIISVQSFLRFSGNRIVFSFKCYYIRQIYVRLFDRQHFSSRHYES